MNSTYRYGNQQPISSVGRAQIWNTPGTTRLLLKWTVWIDGVLLGSRSFRPPRLHQRLWWVGFYSYWLFLNTMSFATLFETGENSYTGLDTVYILSMIWSWWKHWCYICLRNDSKGVGQFTLYFILSLYKISEYMTNIITRINFKKKLVVELLYFRHRA